MARKTGDMREALMDAINQVKSGAMDPSKATAIAKLAGQISLSLQVEANIRIAKLVDEKTEIGGLPISSSPPPAGVLVHRIADDGDA
jgi:flagellar basal body rod protein FlgF